MTYGLWITTQFLINLINTKPNLSLALTNSVFLFPRKSLEFDSVVMI